MDTHLTLCPSCDTHQPLTESGLCTACRDQLRFIVRPEAHREHLRRRNATLPAVELDHDAITVIGVYPTDNSLWTCGLCNDQIPVTAEHTLIPVAGSHALCISCVSSSPYWPQAWTDPTPRTCRCAACQRPVLATLTRLV